MIMLSFKSDPCTPYHLARRKSFFDFWKHKRSNEGIIWIGPLVIEWDFSKW